MIWGAKVRYIQRALELLRDWGDRCNNFRKQGSTDAPGGLTITAQLEKILLVLGMLFVYVLVSLLLRNMGGCDCDFFVTCHLFIMAYEIECVLSI